MIFGRLFARGARPGWKLATRGRKDLPIWRPPTISEFFRRPSVFDDPWFREWGPFGSRSMDDFFRENMRRMDALFKASPWHMMEDFGTQAHSKSADIIQSRFGKDGLHLEMNLSSFDPDDIAVKTSGNRLIISGKHSSKPDEHGFVAREFTREFLIPEEIDTETLSCRLTDRGHLVISAKPKEEPETSREIKIEREATEEESSSDENKEKK